MKKDLKNVIIENILTQEEINTILEIVSKTQSQNFHNELAYNSWHIQLPESIINKFTEHAESIAGIKLKLEEYNFSRYEKITSSCGKYIFNPLLFPHTDEAFMSDRFTLDYQVRSNVSWPITVDNWETEIDYTLKDNEALTFSGTHQVHWRPKKDFIEGEFLELIFMHFAPLDKKELSKEHINEMRKRGSEAYEKWSKQPGITSNGQDNAASRYKEKV
jgi:hypothetical protein